MNITQMLLDATEEIWKAYNKHPFVLGIQNGTLAQEKFRFYMIQDYLYLEEYAKVFAVGVAKAKSPDMARLFLKYISVMEGELNIHSGYLGKFNVSEQEIKNVKRSLDNLSYTSYMLRVAYEEGEAEILTAVLSCAYSYEVIAKRIKQSRPDAIEHPFYGEWIQGYASEEYAKENRILMETLNRLTRHYTKQQQAHLIDIFTTCSRYELAFWDMSWSMSR